MTEKAKIKSISTKQWHQEYLEFPRRIQEVLRKFGDVFEEPRGLPPARIQDHRIPLQVGAQPVNIRPYRYTYELKNEMEKLIKEMLLTSVIQLIHNPYASLVLLVKKKDGS